MTSHPLTAAQFLARLGQLSHRALTAEDIEAQARELVDGECAIITERTAGNRYTKSLRVSTHVMPLEPVTRPADAEQRYVLESEA